MDFLFWKKLAEMAAGVGFSSLLLLAAVYWLNRGNGSLLKDLKQERVRRLEVLEKRSEACEHDREAMRLEIAALQAEVRALYQRLADLSGEASGA